MKTIKITALTSFLVLLGSFILHAQKIDMQRMNQDINIMEGVLNEMFQKVYNHSDLTAFGYEYKNVQGTYLQDYGVIFQINPSYTFIKFVGNNDKKDTSDSHHITKETIINKIVDFLENYGPTIHQLNSNERIMVLFNGVDKPGIRVFKASGKKMKGLSQHIPVISVIAKKSDLTAYQHGDITKKDFSQRIAISSQKSGKNKSQDLKIFANILKTAFKNSADNEFKISGDIDYQHISNFGALFSFSIDYGGGFEYLSSHDGTFTHGIKPIIIKDLNNDSSRVHKIDSLRQVIILHNGKRRKAIQKRLAGIQKRIAKYQKIANKKRDQQTADIKNALHSFINNLKKYIVDYGGTLKSIPSNQNVMLSVKVNESVANIPEQLVLQVKKSVLGAASRGNISRKKAMDKIRVEKY